MVFFNREPVEEDMNRWEKLYYVGADAKESAVLQGDILVDAYRRDSRTLDANGNGLVSYVLLEGETSHQDSLIRTEWSIPVSYTHLACGFPQSSLCNWRCPGPCKCLTRPGTHYLPPCPG